MQDRPVENTIVLEPGRVERNYYLDLWHYRELFAILAWRDVSVRYKQTVFGVLWAFIKPLLTMIVFTVIFGGIAKLPSDGDTPYQIMVFAGSLPWFLFASILTDGANSLVGNANLIAKVYFPRVAVPVAKCGVGIVDLLIGLLVLALIMAWYRYMPGWQIVFLPFFILFAVFASLGPALLMAALNVRYRDFRYVVPFIVQFGLYVSPVGFSSSVVPEEWRFLYSLNPMVGVIDGFRWCILGGESTLYLPGFVISVVIVLLMFWYGVTYFRKTERTIADVI